MLEGDRLLKEREETRLREAAKDREKKERYLIWLLARPYKF